MGYSGSRYMLQYRLEEHTATLQVTLKR